MSSRRPGYLIGVISLALILSLPQLIDGLDLGLAIYSNRGQLPLPEIRGISPLLHAAFWQGKFIHNSHRESAEGNRGIYNWFQQINADTGEATLARSPVATQDVCLPYAFGDKLWFVGANESYEVVDGVVNQRKWPAVSFHDRQLLSWEGQPAFLYGNEICVLKEDVWKSVGMIEIPEVEELRTLSPSPVEFDVFPRSIRVCNSSEGFHLFVAVDGRLYHRQGLEVERVDQTMPTKWNSAIELAVYSPYRPSVLARVGSDAALAGWSLVREKQLPKIAYRGQGQGLNYPGGREHSHGILIGGHAAAVIVDDAQSNNPIARLFWLDGTKWTEVASQPLPFGSRLFTTHTTNDGQRSYLVVARSTDVNHVYAIDASGFHETIGANHSVNSPFGFLFGYVISPVLGLVSGIILSGAVALLMWRFTKPDHEFGVQRVELASLCRRGLARLVDLSFIAISALAFGWVLTRNLDWLTVLEAFNLRVDHPILRDVTIAVAILGVWLVAVVVTLLITQAVWGITPGKWLCHMKTVRTSLRRCGFVASLAREIVFFVDCCNFLCWTPGILSIALTDKRQRLGDLVADTIVVKSESLPPQDTLVEVTRSA